MKFAPAQSERLRGFDLTPMIDVVLQLIIFFMFTSQFGELSRTQVELPREKGQEERLEKATLTVDLTATGELIFESEPISLESFARIAKIEIERYGDANLVTVRVRPDRRCLAAHLNRVMERLSRAGVSKWAIGTMDPLSAPPEDGP
ncbi:MAG: biopolymer transporter ExbD [Phycisphaerales bacterium]